MKTNNFSEIFHRLKPLGITTQQQLARALGITQSAIADAKRRGSFPKGWVVDISQAYNVSVNDLLNGGKLASEVGNLTEPPATTFVRVDSEFDAVKDKLIMQMERNQRLQDEVMSLRAEIFNLRKPKPPTKK